MNLYAKYCRAHQVMSLGKQFVDIYRGVRLDFLRPPGPDPTQTRVLQGNRRQETALSAFDRRVFFFLD